MKWFSKPPLVVEIEKGQSVPPLDAETAKSIAILGEFPGFRYLLTKLRFQQALLKSALDKTHHKTLEDVQFLQAGIAWAGWLENEISTATAMVNRPAPQPAAEPELEAFEKLKEYVTLVGK